MKRFLLLVVIVVLSGGIGYLFIVQPRVPDLLKLVPEESLAVVDWQSPAGSYQAFMDTPFGKQLRAVDLPLILSALGFSKDKSSRVEQLAGNWQAFSRSPFFKQFFGTRTVLALLPPKSSSPDLPAALLKNCVLLNSSGRKTALLRTLVAGLSGGQELPPVKYQGYTIRGYRLNSVLSLYFATDGDLLVAAFDPAPIRQSLDLLLARILQKGGGIAGNADYAELKQRARGLDDFFLYADIAVLKRWLRDLSRSKTTGPAAGISVTTMPRGVGKAVLFHQAFPPIQQFTSIVRFDASELSSFQKRIYVRPPIENRKLANMPANLQVYFWSNWLDLPAWWRRTREHASRKDIRRARRLAEFVDRNLGMEMDDFLALFGQQVGLDIKEIKFSGFFPVPRICFCVELTDRVVVQKLLDKMVADIPIHRALVAGVPVVSVLAAGGLMQPSYALINNYLLMADGRDQIEDILQPTAAMLIRDPDFLKLDMGLQQPNNLVFFARAAQLIQGMKELASWLGTIIAIRDEQAGSRSKVLVDQAVIPLLDGLTMIKAGAVRSYTGPGEIVLQSTILMTDE